MMFRAMVISASALILQGLLLLIPVHSNAQTPPSAGDVSNYQGLHKWAYLGDNRKLQELIAEGADLEQRDGSGRTPIHVAAFASNKKGIKLLAAAGADLNALEYQAYDIVTIAAVANDQEVLEVALSAGASARNVTSSYDGTALIAAAHLGHDKIITALIAAGAPLDHVNNLSWTAMIEVVVLGDGGENHVKSLKALLEAGADRNIADGQGVTPLEHAKSRGFVEMVRLLESR